MLVASQGVEANAFRGQVAVSAVSSALASGDADRFERGTIRRIESKEHVFCDGDPRTHVFRIEEGVISEEEAAVRLLEWARNRE